MMELPKTLFNVFSALRRNRALFFSCFAIIFFVSYGLLYSVDFVPEQVTSPTLSEGSQTTVIEEDVVGGEMEPLSDHPVRIIADVIGLDATIVNPDSRDISALDEALRRGVVHYPGSGNLEDHSNMFLFGHSSFLPNVQNEWYRVFNNLSRLSPGDIIRVETDGYEYRYVVSSVQLVDADEALVEISTRKKKLTLSTCNSFGAKSERFVVEADYLGRLQIPAPEPTA